MRCCTNNALESRAVSEEVLSPVWARAPRSPSLEDEHRRVHVGRRRQLGADVLVEARDGGGAPPPAPLVHALVTGSNVLSPIAWGSETQTRGEICDKFTVKTN